MQAVGGTITQRPARRADAVKIFPGEHQLSLGIGTGDAGSKTFQDGERGSIRAQLKQCAAKARAQRERRAVKRAAIQQQRALQ